MIVKRVVPGHQLRRHHDRNPDFHAQPGLAALKLRRRYAHDGIGVLVDFYVLADDVRIRGEMRLPEAVADHRDGRASGLFIVRGKKAAAEDGMHAKHIEIIGGSHHAPDAFRFTFAREAHGSEDARRDAGKTLLAVAQGLDIRIGKAQVVLGLALCQRYNLPGVGESGNRIEERGIDPAENCGVRTDAQRQSQDHDRGVAGGFGDHAQAVAYILPERGHPGVSAGILEQMRARAGPSAGSCKRLLAHGLARVVLVGRHVVCAYMGWGLGGIAQLYRLGSRETSRKPSHTLKMRLVWPGDVGAGDQGGGVVARIYDDVALLAQFGEVIAYQGLYFLGVNDVADVGFDSFQRLQTRLKMIFTLKNSKPARVWITSLIWPLLIWKTIASICGASSPFLKEPSPPPAFAVLPSE